MLMLVAMLMVWCNVVSIDGCVRMVLIIGAGDGCDDGCDDSDGVLVMIVMVCWSWSRIALPVFQSHHLVL